MTAPPGRGGKREGQTQWISAKLGIQCNLMPNYGVEHNEQLPHARSKRVGK
jgi:hypothetical protein